MRRLPVTAPGYPKRMIWLLLLILAILVFAVVAGLLGRGLFTSR